MGAYNLNFDTPGPAMMPRRIAATPGNTPLDLDFMSQLNAGGTNTPSSFLNLGTTSSVTDQVMQNSQSLIPGTTSSLPMNTGSVPGADTTEGGFNFLGEDGWGNLALGGINAGIQGYMGYKQLGLAKDQLDFQKKAFEKNYAAQRQTTNNQMRDRQRVRHADSGGRLASPEEYMSKNSVK
jgi:hypothetical protein